MGDKGQPPVLIVFAGPNGSGKSSNAEEVKRICGSYPNVYINADEIARDSGMDAYKAAIEAGKRREAALSDGVSFATETVMSSTEKLEFMQRARSLGYHVHLEFILTQDPALNVMRVQNRVYKGGHDVPVDKIIARYERSIAMLPRALCICTTARVVNNTFDNPKLIAKKLFSGKIEIYRQPSPSKWDEENIRRLIGIQKPEEDYAIFLSNRPG